MVFKEHKNNCIMTFLSLNREQDLKMQCNVHFFKKMIMNL